MKNIPAQNIVNSQLKLQAHFQHQPSFSLLYDHLFAFRINHLEGSKSGIVRIKRHHQPCKAGDFQGVNETALDVYLPFPSQPSAQIDTRRFQNG